MKKKVIMMMFVAVSLVVAAVNVQARWGNDPANDPVYQQFIEDTADIRKEIAMDSAELRAMLAGENPDTYKARELSARIADNKQKLAELASANGFGRGGGGGCGAACRTWSSTRDGRTRRSLVKIRSTGWFCSAM